MTPEHASTGQRGEPLAGPSQGEAPERPKSCAKCGGEKDSRHSYCRACRSEYFRQNNQRPERKANKLKHERSPKGKLTKYKRNARLRGYTWALTDEQALFIFAQPCAYCGKSPCMGIDRRKNEYGYTVSNSLPCCAVCNGGKHTKTAGGFIEMCKDVAKHCIDRETFMARNAELQKQLKEFEQWQSESTSAEPAE